jgi:O-methyltransferase
MAYTAIPVDINKVEVLADPRFRAAYQAVASLTLLDIPRLANLWQLVQMSNPEGIIVELGVYRGGSAALLAQAAPGRRFILCDSFEGFGTLPLDSRLDSGFERGEFANTSANAVDQVMRQVSPNYKILAGFFPGSDVDGDIKNVSFAHVDFDLYSSTLEALNYLSDRVAERAIFVLDDFFRKAEGVMKATSEFLLSHKDFAAFPLFPSQGVIFHKSWFDAPPELWTNYLLPKSAGRAAAMIDTK